MSNENWWTSPPAAQTTSFTFSCSRHKWIYFNLLNWFGVSEFNLIIKIKFTLAAGLHTIHCSIQFKINKLILNHIDHECSMQPYCYNNFPQSIHSIQTINWLNETNWFQKEWNEWWNEEWNSYQFIEKNGL